jgi:hypothetical protein
MTNMRIDQLPVERIAGYNDFTWAAVQRGNTIQAQLNDVLADGREHALDLCNTDESFKEYQRNVLRYISPQPTKPESTVLSRAMVFGAYLSSLLAAPKQAVLDTTTVKNLPSIKERAEYMNKVSREYLEARRPILDLVDRNLLYPRPSSRFTKQLLSVTGLIIMQHEEHHFNDFLSEQDAKLATELSAEFGGVLPDDWKRKK